MKEKVKDKNETTRKKSFFAKVFEKLDKKMEEKAKSESCGCRPPNGKDNNSCCG